jgi:hypothetical protein
MLWTFSGEEGICWIWSLCPVAATMCFEDKFPGIVALGILAKHPNPTLN